VQNVEASRAVLRRPDAAYLPAGWPGRGYFQVGEQGVFKQFQTAYVSGDYRPQPGEETLLLTLVTETGEVVNLLPDAPPAPTPLENRSVARAVCEAVTEYANMQGVPPMPPLLLPPLPDTITLLPPFDAGDVGGWNGETWLATDGVPPGSAPAGMVDDVYNRAQYPLWIHLAGGESDRTRRDGHVIVVGSPASGKTTFIRTLALSQALLHPPEALHMYFLSFTGTGLDDMGRLPHAERVIHGADAARVRRLFARLIATLDERQAGRAPRTPLIMVCIDQFEGFRDAYRDQHMPDFDRLINEGRAAGIALVITASTITAIPDRVRAQVEQRIALHLGDPADTLLAVGRLNTLVDSARAPGRGFLHSSPVLTCQISLPCLTTLGGVAENMNTLIDAMRAARPQQAPSPIRELPTYVPFEALPTPAHTERVITPLGWLDDDRLSVYMLDWREAGMHFVVAGAPGSGKTNLLHVAALAAAAAHSPADLRFVLVDIDGRSLRAIGGLQHVAARVTDPAALSEVFARLRVELAAEHEALSNNGAAPRTPATIVLIDDYDALGEALRGDDTTLALLRDCARLYPDLPFHIWVAGYFERVGDPLLRYLLLRRAGFGLGTRDSLQKLNVRTAGLPADLLPAGRMFVPERDRISIVQTALVENPAGTVGHINDLWGDFAPATWSSPTPETPRAHRATRRPPTEIDTAGLIEDLLGASDTD
jgi:S-DNA-T family DNA segregation ATPase FtsK/SpoIIIE